MDRLIALHEKLSSGQHYTFDELREACEQKTDQTISEKTLYNDLNDLRDLGAIIPKRDRSGRPYFYKEPFSLYGVLNPTDAALANEAVALLRQMNTLPQFAGLEDVMLRFEQQAGVIGKPRESVVQFDQNQQYKGLNWLPELYKAIQDDHPVLIHYTGFGQSTAELRFSPYLLKEYNNRWHVYGRGAESLGLDSLALDRIDTLKLLPDLRRQPNHTDWTAHLNDVVGFTHLTNVPLETWILRIRLPRARYVETKPLHHSQEIVEKTAEYWDFRYRLKWNNELNARILELGADAELIAPEKYRQQLVGMIQAMMNRYLK
ncbi:helix-turn-helix transcriptional regulator [Spirosoma koreense]